MHTLRLWNNVVWRHAKCGPTLSCWNKRGPLGKEVTSNSNMSVSMVPSCASSMSCKVYYQMMDFVPFADNNLSHFGTSFSKLKCEVISRQIPSLLSFCPSEMTLCPENSAAFLCWVDLRLPPCVIQFQATFLDVLSDNGFPRYSCMSPCGYFDHGGVTVSHVVPAGGLTVTYSWAIWKC